MIYKCRKAYNIDEKIIQVVTFRVCIWFVRDSSTESWFAKETLIWRAKRQYKTIFDFNYNW